MNIVVTGASRGIGFATVLALAKHPQYLIYAVARDTKGLGLLIATATQQHQHKNIIAVPLDLTQNDGIGWTTLQHITTVDILINNAGYLQRKPFLDLTDEDWQAHFSVNVFAVVRLIQQLLPALKRSPQAHIVNIGSMGGVQQSKKFAGLAAYSASKAALANLTESLAEELKGDKIAVNCLALGAVQTEMFDAAFPDSTALVSDQQMGEYIAHFSVNGSRFYNGKILPVAISTP